MCKRLLLHPCVLTYPLVQMTSPVPPREPEHQTEIICTSFLEIPPSHGCYAVLFMTSSKKHDRFKHALWAIFCLPLSVACHELWWALTERGALQLFCACLGIVDVSFSNNTSGRTSFHTKAWVGCACGYNLATSKASPMHQHHGEQEALLLPGSMPTSRYPGLPLCWWK